MKTEVALDNKKPYTNIWTPYHDEKTASDVGFFKAKKIIFSD